MRKLGKNGGVHMKRESHSVIQNVGLNGISKNKGH